MFLMETHSDKNKHNNSLIRYLNVLQCLNLKHRDFISQYDFIIYEFLENNLAGVEQPVGCDAFMGIRINYVNHHDVV